jgi:hypothetical protein
VSRDAVEYVRERRLTDPAMEQVFLLLAERTTRGSGRFGDERQYVMGLELRDTEIPDLAAGLGMAAEEFRRLLRLLKSTVPMDALEHSDGVWEIVYGRAYTDPKPPPRKVFDEANIPGINAFPFPGWEKYSTWGSEEGLGHLYAQLYRNTDDRDAEPRIWITPPRYVVRTLDELAAAIAEAIAPYQQIPPPPEVIKLFLKKQS